MGLFNRAIFNNAIFNTSPEVTRGGVADYRRYREQLKRIADAADRRLYKKVEERIERLIEEAPAEIAAPARRIQREYVPDFAALAAAETAGMHAMLLKMITLLGSLLDETEQEDELILMMVIH